MVGVPVLRTQPKSLPVRQGVLVYDPDVRGFVPGTTTDRDNDPVPILRPEDSRGDRRWTVPEVTTTEGCQERGMGVGEPIPDLIIIFTTPSTNTSSALSCLCGERNGSRYTVL